MKIYSNHPAHLINMAATPIYGKTLSESLKDCFSGTNGPMALEHLMLQWVFKLYQECSNNDDWLTLTFLW